MRQGFIYQTGYPGAVVPHEDQPVAAITPKVGLALKWSSGVLAVATGSNKPEYICAQEESSAVSSGTVVRVIKILPSMEFETTFSVAASSIVPGDKVTLHASNGQQVTATKVDSSSNPIGVAEVVRMNGTASGSKVIVRFP